MKPKTLPKMAAAVLMLLLLTRTPAAHAAGSPSTPTQTFPDVPPTHWANAQIQTCLELGIVAGYDDGTFAPSGTVTGAQFATMLDRMFYSSQLSANSGSGQSWYVPALKTADEMGILTGTAYLASGSRDNWQSSANLDLSRYDMAQMLYNVLRTSGKAPSTLSESVSDFRSIPSSYQTAVGSCISTGIITGMSDGTFSGGQTMTRAQACVVMTRMLDTVGSSGSENPAETSVTVKEDAAQTVQTSEELCAEVIRLVNAERAKEGLSALGTFDALTTAAQKRAPELVQKFDHTRPDGRDCFTALKDAGVTGYYTAGENIAAGYPTAAAVVSGWMDSPGHRANILNKDFTHIGVGYDNSGNYWVQMFVGTSNTGSDTVQTPAVALKLQGNKDISLTAGETWKLTATATGTTSTASITYRSSNQRTVSVDSNGLISAKEAGTATITASMTWQGKTYTDSCFVTVNPKEDLVLTIAPKTLQLVSGETGTVKGTVTGSGSISPVSYSSSDASVAAVDPSGTVTAKAPGTAVITATMMGKDDTYTDQCTVTVKAPAVTQTAEDLCAEVIQLVNAERAKEGLSALGTFDTLTAAAETRAPELVRKFDHTRPDGSDCFSALKEAGVTGYYTAGENIAAGSSTAEGVMNQWMNSPGHRANILNKDFTHIGVGYQKDGNYWVQMFVGTANSGSGTESDQEPESTSGSGGFSVTSSDLPSNNRTKHYSENWSDGSYLDIQIENDNTIVFSGCVEDLPSYYNYVVLRAMGRNNTDETAYTAGVPFSLRVTVDVDALSDIYHNDTSQATLAVTALVCQHYTPGDSSYAGTGFLDCSNITLALDGSGGIELQINRR